MKSDQLESKIRSAFAAAASDALGSPVDPLLVQLDNPKNENFGDLTTNFALRVAKEARANPRDVAAKIVAGFESKAAAEGVGDFVSALKVEGPGFINIEYSKAWYERVVREAVAPGADFGRISDGLGKKLLLEYVSANPTGPLTVAHGRQAALGDALARILRFAGFDVETEYYNNDEGVQINTLGISLELRYKQLLGAVILMPENCYRGEYLLEIARDLKRQVEEGKISMPAKAWDWSVFARDAIMKTIVHDLEEFGVKFDNFYSQEALGKSGRVEKTLEELKAKGHVYEQDGAVWFRSTAFGDDKDRVLIKSDKNYTYLTPDIAYHHHKFSRGYTDLVNILGPDHHGYIARLKASQAALGHDASRLRVQIAQLVTLYKGGEQVRMSTRAGEFITLREILDEVGKDAGRFFFCMRKFDSHLDFDLELAKKETPDNPVFYIQYAYARIASIKRLQAEKGILWEDQKIDLSSCDAPEEIRLLRKMAQFPRAVSASAASLEPSVMIDYLKELAGSFHSFYAQCKVVGDDLKATQARLSPGA